VFGVGIPGEAGGGTMLGVGVTGGGEGGVVVGVGMLAGGVACGGFATLPGETAFVTWPIDGLLTVPAREPEESADASPIPTPTITTMTTEMIPRRLLMMRSFDSVVGSRTPRLGAAGISDLFLRS
jgi:hypothetical protein